ncbi:NYN domain-containing protein [Cellulomonas endophytica]|uniref:NYN domain-containing protein n=1 Tax=Cellulomonas endophytica TaxID=2494735 RepID=UPI0013E9755F|nr:NYN domain-containing protein [Cellulomonas endophytica]
MTVLDSAPALRRHRCALFVDFDNVYLGLQRLDPRAAEAFASHPGDWLAQLGQGTDADGDYERRFLVRACYLNPSAFSQFRPNFTRAGFSVVDCPSLTQQGKSSADINLVLDAVDALDAPTRYDEFVILSADADFTPLALRCRAADRRVTIVTAGPAASAYRAVADTVVTADEFVELVQPPEPEVPVLTTAPAASTGSAAPGTAPASNGSGSGSGSGSGRSRGGRRGGGTTGPAPEAVVGTGTVPGAGTDAAPAAAPAAPAPGAAAPAAAAVPSPARRAVLRLVRQADRPLNGGNVAQAAAAADPSLAADWGGTGSFLGWLHAAVPELSGAAGFVWDPRRFSEADLPGAAPVDLPPLQRQVVEVTDIPNLAPDRYRSLLQALADDVAHAPFERAETARRVRDACQAAGQSIGRGSVNAVVSGLLYAGLDLAARPGVDRIARTWADHVVGLCQGARMELRGPDAEAIRTWVSGGLVPRGA